MEEDEEKRRKRMTWPWHVAFWELQSQQGVRGESRYRLGLASQDTEPGIGCKRKSKFRTIVLVGCGPVPGN